MNDQKKQRVEWTWIAVGLIAVSGWFVDVSAPWSTQNEVVDARMIRLIDAEGRPRMLLAAPLPDPQIQETVYERSRPVQGIMFLDTLGNETGGVGLFDDIQGGGFCFDYATAEAVCLTKASAMGFVGLTMLDPPPEGSSPGVTGSERVGLNLFRGASQLVLSDSKGRPRIRLLVDSLDVPRFEMLDSNGQIVFAR